MVMAGLKNALFLGLSLQSLGFEYPKNTVELAALGANDATDPLKTWMKSLQFHLPDSENATTEEGTTAHFKYHDTVCTNLQFDRIHSDTYMTMGDPALELMVDGVTIDCKGQFSALGTVSWLLVGSGSWEAKLTNGGAGNGAEFEILFRRQQTQPDLAKLTSLKCQVAFNAEVEVKGGLAVKTANIMQRVLSPFVNGFVQYQIQSKACAALEDLIQVKARPYLQQVNHLFFQTPLPQVRRLSGNDTKPVSPIPVTPATNGTVPNSSTDASATSSDAPLDQHDDSKLVDWTKSELLQWSNWFYTKVLPPEVARELAKAAGADFLTVDLTELNLPPIETVVDQHGALGMIMQIKVEAKEFQLKGLEGVQAYGMEALSPTQLHTSVSLGSEESPVTTVAVKLAMTIEAKDTTSSGVAASLEEEVSFMVAVNKPSSSMQIKVPIGVEKMNNRYTLAQWLVDTLNCGLSLLEEAPTLEEVNISFESLSKPLSYTADTEGELEQDISDFFNAMVKIFNVLFEEHLPGAIARLATSEQGLDIANALLKKQASPAQCISATDAQEKIKGQYPEIYSDWPKMLDGQSKKYVDKMVHGLLNTNETKAPEGWLEMPPVNAGSFTNIHVKALKATGTHQITEMKMLETNPKTPETISFGMTTACRSDEAPYPASVVMNVEGTLDVTGEALVEVELPCGTLETTLNLSVDTLEAVTMLMPPSLFCTLLSPFQTIAVANLTTAYRGAGKVYVTIAGGTRHDVVQEMCGNFPRLCALMGRIGEAMVNKDNATLVLSYMHQEAVGVCDKMIKAKGRRLSDDLEIQRDSLGVPYQEFSFGLLSLWLGLLLSIIGAGVVVWCIKYMDEKSVRRDNASLAVHIIRHYGIVFAYVISLLLFLSVSFRDLACNKLAYASVVLTNVYKPSNKILDTQTLAVFTSWGLAYQFKEANFLLAFEWVLNGLGVTIGIFVVFGLSFWIISFPYTVHHIILRVGIFFARRPWQESATLGLSALALTSDLELPVDIEGQMRLNMWAGPLLGLFSTLFLTAAAIGMLVTLPVKSVETHEEEGRNRMMLVDLVLCSGVILGMFIWFFFDFVEVGFRGLASTVLETKSFSGMQIGTGNATVKLSVLLVFVLAPLMQACLVITRVMGLKLMSADLHRALEEIFMSLNSLDIFALAFFVGFLTGIDGFASSFVNTEFAPLCQATQYVAGLPCIGVNAKTATFGSIGLAIGAACSVGLYIRSSIEFHGLVARPVRRRDVESDGQATAVELQ